MIDNNGRTLTVGQLHVQVKRLAFGLSQKGLGKGDVLCLFAPNMLEYASVLYAVSMLGATTTTANPLYTSRELAQQLKDSQSKMIVTIGPFFEKVKEAAAECDGAIKEIYVLGDAPGAQPIAPLFAQEGPLPPVKINVREDPVVLPYSSGTTGLPKGVVLTHYNIVANINQIMALEEDVTFMDDTIVMAVLPFFHVYGLVVLMMVAVYKGIKMIIVPKFDLPEFLKLIQQHKITILPIVPPIVLALAKHPIVANFDISSVKLILSGAAPLGKAIESEVNARFPSIKVKQAYGMTEASPATNVVPMNGLRAGSVGVSLANLELKIINTATGELLDIGQEGELCFRGPNIMKGYLNNPKATAETIDSDGFLHTGDIGRVDNDGYCYIVDRAKELIKFKGFQVPPAELEALLLTHPAVADSAVIGKPDEEAGEIPKAFIVLKPNQTATAEEIIKFIDDLVAPHKKLRGGVAFIAQIPKSASGKILRRELKAQELAGGQK